MNLKNKIFCEMHSNFNIKDQIFKIKKKMLSLFEKIEYFTKHKKLE